MSRFSELPNEERGPFIQEGAGRRQVTAPRGPLDEAEVADPRRAVGGQQYRCSGARGVAKRRGIIGKVEPARSLLHTASTWINHDSFSRHGASSMNPFKDNHSTVPMNGRKGDVRVIPRGGWFAGEPRFSCTKPNLLCPVGHLVHDPVAVRIFADKTGPLR